MSKVDATRAMREARYAAARAAKSGSLAVKPAVASTVESSAPVAEPAEAAAEPTEPLPAAPVAPTAEESTKEGPTDDSPAEALCGHRSMNNRSCRRPAGHPEKSHRYS